MNPYDFSEEQNMLKDMVAKFAEKEVKPYVSQIDETGELPAHIWPKMVELGLIGMCYPEEYGGGGMTCVEGGIFLEEMSKVDANTAMIGTSHELGMMPILIAGSDEIKQKYVPRIASGEWYCSFGLTEADAGSDASGVKTYAEDKGDHWLINGSKRFCSFSDTANLISLFAKTDLDAPGVRGISAFAVEMSSPGISIGKHEDKLGFRAVHACEVFFDNVQVPKENLLGEAGRGFKIAMQTLDRTRPLVACQAVGLAQGALDFAVQYSMERIQFGKPIAANQGLQWMMADMNMQIEAARQLAYKAANECAVLGDRMGILGSMAKAFCTDVAMKVCTDALQVCGGSGYMKEYPQEKRLRDAKLLQIVEGTNQIQRVVISNHMFGKL